MNKHIAARHLTRTAATVVLASGVVLAASSNGQADTPTANVLQKVSKDPTLVFIAAGIRNELNTLESLETTVTIENHTPKEAFDELRKQFAESGTPLRLPEQHSDSRKTATLIYRKPRLDIEVDNSNANEGKLIKSRLVSDGAVAKTLEIYQDSVDGKIDQYAFGHVFSASEMVVEGVAKNAFSAVDPRVYMYYQFPNGPSIVSLLTSATSDATVKGEVEIDGDVCTEIVISFNPTRSMELCIDKKHHFMIRRLRELAKVDNISLPTREVTVTLNPGDKNAFAPMKVVDRRFLYPSRQDAKAMPGTGIESTTTVTFGDIVGKRPAPDELFQLTWPAGTNVTNHPMQQNSVVTVGPALPEEAK